MKEYSKKAKTSDRGFDMPRLHIRLRMSRICAQRGLKKAGEISHQISGERRKNRQRETESIRKSWRQNRG